MLYLSFLAWRLTPGPLSDKEREPDDFLLTRRGFEIYGKKIAA